MALLAAWLAFTIATPVIALSRMTTLPIDVPDQPGFQPGAAFLLVGTDTRDGLTEQEKKELSDDAWKQVNAKVEQTRQQLNEQIAENDQKNREYYKAESDHLQSIYDSNAKQWRQEFVERITKDPSHTS